MLGFKGEQTILRWTVRVLMPYISDMTVELATEDDCFLKDIVHLLLEVKVNAQFVGIVNLLSRESKSGLWKANELLIM
jgi:hypothetical protein